MWEKKLVERDNSTSIDEKELAEILEQDRLILNKIGNYSEFWNIKSRLFHALHQKGRARSVDDLGKFKKIIDNVLLKSEDKALYFETQYLFHHIYSAYYFGVGDYKHSYNHLDKLVKHIEGNINKFKEEPNIYFSVLTNIIYVGSQLKAYKEVFGYLAKLHDLLETLLLDSTEDLDIKLFSSTNSIELTLYAITAQFEKGEMLIPQIEEGFRLYDNKINGVRKAYIQANVAIMYFGLGDLNKALKWTHSLLNDTDMDKTQDIFCFSQILNLIIHYELGNKRLLPYAYKSAVRYMPSRNRVYRFEKIFLAFINERIKDKEKIDKAAFEEVLEELQNLKDDPFEKAAFEYFDFTSWLESKIKGVSFKEIVQEKIKRIPI